MIPATENSPTTGATAGAPLGDTTYTKVFVGGLAWETQKDTLRNYFQQFGDILEAVVITDRATSRSKGYGFVTFREPEAAMRACVDATPVIDGRRANCNLACLGAQRSKPSSPSVHTGRHGNGISKNGKGMKSNGEARYAGGVGGAAFVGGPGVGMTHIPHYAIQQGFPLTHYYGGYFPYSADYAYPMNYYGVHGGGGGGAAQFQIYGAAGATTGGMMNCFYPYHLQYGDQASTVGGTAVATNTNATAVTDSYGLHYPHPHPLFQFSSATLPQQHYNPPMSFAAASTPMQSGVTRVFVAPKPHC